MLALVNGNLALGRGLDVSLKSATLDIQMSMTAAAGIQYIGKPEGYGEEKRQEYTANDYHGVTDEIKPDWDLAGAVDDLRLMFRVGFSVAQAAAFPEWMPGTEFKAKRDAMMSGATSH